MRERYAIPKLHIRVNRIRDSSGQTHFRWAVTMMAPDAKGERSLGYRGSGTIKADLSGLVFERGPEVHDECRPVWTPMNPTDRPDIRRSIAQRATFATRKLKESGEDSFEHNVP